MRFQMDMDLAGGGELLNHLQKDYEEQIQVNY